mgnify:CR=1 FL=1
MNNETLDKYIITYSNHFEFNGKVLAYRKKILFDITSTPNVLSSTNNNGSNGYWINRKWLSESKIKELIKHEPKQIDVSNLQWYTQIELDECFNLEKHD